MHDIGPPTILIKVRICNPLNKEIRSPIVPVQSDYVLALNVLRRTSISMA